MRVLLLEFFVFLIGAVQGIHVILNPASLLDRSQEGLRWSDSIIWTPRPPEQGDDVTVDLTTYAGCGQPLIVDVDTRKRVVFLCVPFRFFNFFQKENLRSLTVEASNPGTLAGNPTATPSMACLERIALSGNGAAVVVTPGVSYGMASISLANGTDGFLPCTCSDGPGGKSLLFGFVLESEMDFDISTSALDGGLLLPDTTLEILSVAAGNTCTYAVGSGVLCNDDKGVENRLSAVSGRLNAGSYAIMVQSYNSKSNSQLFSLSAVFSTPPSFGRLSFGDPWQGPCTSSIVVEPSVTLWADSVHLVDKNTRLLLADPSARVLAQHVEEAAGSLIGGSGVVSAVTSDIHGYLVPGRTNVGSCAGVERCWPGMGDSEIYGDLVFEGNATLHSTSMVVIRGPGLAAQPTGRSRGSTDTVLFGHVTVNASVVRLQYFPPAFDLSQVGFFGIIEWLDRSTVSDFFVERTPDCWSLSSEMECCTFCFLCEAACLAQPVHSICVVPSSVNELSVVVDYSTVVETCVALQRGDIILSQRGKNFVEGEALEWSDPRIWFPRPPLQGDNVTVDITGSWSFCVAPCEERTPDRLSPWLVVDEDTPTLQRVTIITNGQCRTSIVIAAGVKFLAKEIDLGALSRLFLEPNSKIGSSYFKQAPSAWLGGFGIINASQSVIGGVIFPGCK